MFSLSITTRLALLISLLLIGAVGLAFYRGQNNSARIGGGISAPKAIWLTYAVYVWFFMTPILALESNVALHFRIILGTFAVSMWIRGVAELLMLYIWKNWRPPYGIAHNILSIFILVGGCFLYIDKLSLQADNLSQWLLGYIIFLIAAMVCETYYAIRFHDTVQGQTTGDTGIWFASADQAKFQRINTITAICNTPLVGFTLAFILTWVP